MIGKILTMGFVCAGMAVGQAVTSPAKAGAAAGPTAMTTTTAAALPAKAYAFEVISIRPNTTPMQPMMGPPQFGPTADGYRSTNQSLLIPLLTAYVPQVGGTAFYSPQDQIKGLPDWLMSERYDIDARIADEDRAEWQKPDAQKAMLQSMLQAMLVERCKLTMHREVKETGVSR